MSLLPITKKVFAATGPLDEEGLAEGMEDCGGIYNCTGNFCCYVNENGSSAACIPTVAGGGSALLLALGALLFVRRRRAQANAHDNTPPER